MVISAVEKMVKPEPDIYRLLMERYGLVAEECIFLDDRADNIETARQLGMAGIVFQDYEQAKKELEYAGVSFE
jgi:HAD superfamily hydrolase (TIGR01509 family)